MLCWLNVDDDDDDDDHDHDHDGASHPRRGHPRWDELRAELATAARMLSAVMQTEDVDLATRVGPLVAKEPLLARLFGGGDDGRR